MKHYYFQSGIFRSIKVFGIVLSTVTFISACSGEIEDLSSGSDATESGQEVAKDNSILRFKTIEELENISVTDIPGDYAGYELAELAYECTDTIELRALRFDVTATLTSVSGPAKTVCFEAEVGPELVSVEYYPCGEMVPTHHNMWTAFYAKVERYRNYSDGSRIGPDSFYDYGHFLMTVCRLRYLGLTTANMTHPYFISENIEIIPPDLGSDVNPDYHYYKDGVFYTHQKGLIEYNLNTTVIARDGTIYSGEDFFHTNVRFREDLSTLREPTAQARDFYNKYRPSRFADGHDADEEFAYYANLCRDVPDVSPSPHQVDTKSLAPGFYYGEFLDDYLDRCWINSDYELSLDDKPIFSFGRNYYMESMIYLQYLVIDNRIIDFVDIAMKDYKSLAENFPTFSISKTSSGYMVHSEFEQIMYGEKFKSVYDLEMKGIYGPENNWDLCNYSFTHSTDQEELNDLTTRSAEVEDDMKALIQREDGKTMVIDKHLPSALDNIPTRRSIKRK